MSAPCARASANRNSLCRVLLPPNASPVQSSRLMKTDGPPRDLENRGNGSSGVGKWASRTRGNRSTRSRISCGQSEALEVGMVDRSANCQSPRLSRIGPSQSIATRRNAPYCSETRSTNSGEGGHSRGSVALGCGLCWFRFVPVACFRLSRSMSNLPVVLAADPMQDRGSNERG